MSSRVLPCRGVRVLLVKLQVPREAGEGWRDCSPPPRGLGGSTARVLGGGGSVLGWTSLAMVLGPVYKTCELQDVRSWWDCVVRGWQEVRVADEFVLNSGCGWGRGARGGGVWSIPEPLMVLLSCCV